MLSVETVIFDVGIFYVLQVCRTCKKHLTRDSIHLYFPDIKARLCTFSHANITGFHRGAGTDPCGLTKLVTELGKLTSWEGSRARTRDHGALTLALSQAL